MRIALIASPFIPVPPPGYGGTELFVATLAEALKRKGIEVVVYSNGEATVDVERRWCYRESDWPLADEFAGITKELDHLSWSLEDAAQHCDVIHINSAPGVVYARFVEQPLVCTLHHPFTRSIAALYERYPRVHYAAISHLQANLHSMLRVQTIHHGINLSQYKLQAKKAGYLSFLGRIAPIKGTHLAVEVALKTGIPLKIAGEIQPIFRDYYEAKIKPHVDGRLIEYVGEADLAIKNELLGNSAALLFPIDWDEPFGLVMIEAMACGTPVLAPPRGSVPEVVCAGVSGEICSSVEQMAQFARNLNFDPVTVRDWVAQRFSDTRMAESYVQLYSKTLGVRVFPAHEVAPDPEGAAA